MISFRIEWKSRKTIEPRLRQDSKINSKIWILGLHKQEHKEKQIQLLVLGQGHRVNKILKTSFLRKKEV